MAKSFVSALFMGLRTARIHDESNRAFENAVRTLFDATQALFAATGGFRMVFIGDTTMLNDARLKLDGSSLAVTRSIRGALEAKQMGGLVVGSPPTFQSSKALIDLLRREGQVSPDQLSDAQLSFLPPQAFSSESGDARIDPNERAIRVYAKLLIALRSHLGEAGEEDGFAEARRTRLARVVQDLIEASTLAPGALLLLANHEVPDWRREQQGAGVCALSVSVGQVLGLERAALMDLGVGAAVHHLGVDEPRSPVLDDEAVQRGFFRGLARSNVSPSTAQRTAILANHRRPIGPIDRPGVEPAEGGKSPVARPTLSARIVGLAATYMQLTTGFGLRRQVRGHPVDVLALLARDRSRRFDPDLVDLLINMLRAFPVGVEVVLASGGRGVVSSHGGGRRWDRPVVAQTYPRRRNVDLMVRHQGRFVDAIVGTVLFLGAQDVERPFDQAPDSEPRAAAPLTADLETITQRPDQLRSMPDEAEALLRDFLHEE